MKKKSKNRMNFGLGLLAGIFIGYYLGSDEGQELRKKAQQHFEEFSEELGEKLQEQIGSIATGVDTIVSKGQQYVEDVESSFQSEIDKTNSIIASARNSFMRGMERARRSMDEQDEEDGAAPSA